MSQLFNGFATVSTAVDWHRYTFDSSIIGSAMGEWSRLRMSSTQSMRGSGLVR